MTVVVKTARPGWCVVVVLSALVGWAVPAPAQRTDGPSTPTPGGDPTARPTEYGIRFTPEMARAMSKAFTREVLLERYQLDDAKADEAADLIARHLMKLAHAHEPNAQDLIEYLLAEVSTVEAEGGMPCISRSMGMGIGRRVLSVLPACREFVRDVGQDIRPMLSLPNQLKFGADLMAVHTALDALGKNMEEWAKGNVDPFPEFFEPFESPDKETETDENGESKALKQAGEVARRILEARWEAGWAKYVAEAKQYYELDESQAATADSILREVTERARVVIQDETWRKRMYRNRLWRYLLYELPGDQHSPPGDHLDSDYVEMAAPIVALGDELKERVDRIPTEAQQRAAEARVRAALGEIGVDVSTIEKDDEEP